MNKGSKIIAFNADTHGGGCGYKQTNFAIHNDSDKYLIFYANLQ